MQGQMFYNKSTRANRKHLAKDGVLLLELNRTRFVPVCPGKQLDTKRVRFDSGDLMNKMTETQKAYLAGLIDGEGCIYITKYTTKGKGMHPTYALGFCVVMTSEDTIRYCHEISGVGHVHFSKRRHRKSCHRDQWYWSVNKAETVEFLQEIYPYLMLKKPQAKLAIEFGTVVSPGHRFGRYDANLNAKREAYFQEIKRLKWVDGRRENYTPEPDIELPPMPQPMLW